MEFKIIKEEEYKKFWENHPLKTFLSSIEIGKLRHKSGWKVHYVGVLEKKKIVAATMMVSRKKKFGKEEFYAPRGFLLDFRNQELLGFFTVNVKK